MRFKKDELRQGILWTIGILLFFWFFARVCGPYGLRSRSGSITFYYTWKEALLVPLGISPLLLILWIIMYFKKPKE